MNKLSLAVILVVAVLFPGLPFSVHGADSDKGYGGAVYNELRDNEFLTKWLVLGPFPFAEFPGNIPDKERIKHAFDEDILTTVLVNKKKALNPVEYKGMKYRWKFTEANSGLVHLNEILGNSEYAISYALAEINMNSSQTLLMGLGSDDAVKVWLNGKEIFRNYTTRSLSPDADVFELTLNKGSNQLLIKILNERSDYGFSFRAVTGTPVARHILHSVETGDFDGIKTLAKYSPDWHQTNENGLNAWQLSQLKGRADIAEFLEKQGVDQSTSFPPLENYIDRIVTSIIPSKNSPGVAILVACDGEILFKKGYGLADIGYHMPVTTVTKFRIGSVTKTFISSAILKLQEEGKLSISDKLSAYIPDFPEGDKITIYHLLTHTSGIYNVTAQPGFKETKTVYIEPEKMVDLIKSGTSSFEPGEEFRYNNSGYFILGYLIEKVTGLPYGEYLKKTFFDPLGMKNTGVHSSGLILENEATGYTQVRKGTFGKDTNWDMSRAGGAGSLYSTAEDLYLWNEAVFNGKVLHHESLQQTFTSITLKNGRKPEEMDYGMGWTFWNVRGIRFIGHGGGLNGFASQLTHQPEEKLTVVVLSNCMPPMDNKTPYWLSNTIAEYLLWKKMEIKNSYIADTSMAKNNIGIYKGRFDYGNGMVLTVTAEHGVLYAQMTGQERFEIFPKGKDEFFWKVVDARIKFQRNESWEITHAIHYQGGKEFSVYRLPEIKTVNVEPAILERYTGDYAFQPNVIISITVGNGKLYAHPGGVNRVELFPVSEIEFVAKDMNAILKFIPGDNCYNILIKVGENEKLIKKLEK